MKTHTGPWMLALLCSLPSVLKAQPSPPLLVSDGAWCWFGNPRATFKDGLCYFGYVRFSDGRAGLNTYDPSSGVSSNLWLSGMTQKDDHDNPALLPLSDGRLLAIYQKHGSEKKFYFRVSADANSAVSTNWGSEWQWTNTTAGVTYANPYQLSAESGKVYSFLRNLNFNPTFISSDASGTNWSAPQILVKTGTGGSRPYVQYCSDFVDRIDFTYTDAHPTDAGTNCLYHAYYRAGGLYKTDGTFLKLLANAPLLHDSGERGTLVYQYSTAPSSDPNDHIQYGRAWSWDVAYQSNGAPVTVFTVQRTNVMGSNWYDDRIYYYYARWTGTNWQKRFIAHAGRPLYSTQRDYAGGISLDPVRPDVVYLASNAADPFNIGDITTVPLRANDRYEVFRGVTADGGLTFTWQAVTTNSIVDNLRPYVPRRNPYPVGVLWYAGTYTSYTAWNTAVYGLFTTNLTSVCVVPNTAPRVSIVSPRLSPVVLTNLANRLELGATATDEDGPGPLTLTWSTVSGPTQALFSDPDQAVTSVSFLQTGAYVLRLTASDSERAASADLSVIAGNFSPPAADPTLALWLKLDEGAGSLAYDSSGNENNGSVYGNGSWTTPGAPRGGGFEFNGTNSFISVPDAANLDNAGAMTLAFWMRANATTAGGAGLVSKRNAVSDNNAFTTFLQVDQLINVDLDSGNNRFTSVSTIVTGRWYHVAVTFDGSQATNQRARFYLNGNLERVAAESSPSIPNCSSTLKVGLTHSNVTTYFNGGMDDIRLYRRALSDLEVVTLAASTAPSVLVGPAPAATNYLTFLLSGNAVDDGLSGPLGAQWSMASGPGEVGFNPNQPACTATATGSGDYVLKLTASNATAAVFQTLPVQVQPNPDVYQDWAASFSLDTTDPELGGPLADPDHDGVANLMEFALGMNPIVADAVSYTATQSGLPVAAIQSFSGTNFLTMSVQGPANRFGLQSFVGSGSSLSNWNAAVQVTSSTNGAGIAKRVYRDTVPTAEAPGRFMSLKVSQP